MSDLVWGEPANWLVLEGLVPLFGAGVLYLLWGTARYVARSPGVAIPFSWKEWMDPLGWLYGAIILAVQAGVRSYQFHESLALTVACFAAGGISLFLLIAAMNERGAKPTWVPTTLLKVVAALLIVAILAAGYQVHVLAELQGGKKC
jgi:hypothetical protein